MYIKDAEEKVFSMLYGYMNKMCPDLGFNDGRVGIVMYLLH